MFHLGRLLPSPKRNTKLRRLKRDKHSSLLQKFVNYGRKKFCDVGPGVNVIKLLFPLFAKFNTKLECLLIGRKSLPRTNTVAYYENPLIRDNFL